MNDILAHPSLAALIVVAGRRGVVTRAVRAELDQIRTSVLRGSGVVDPRPRATAVGTLAEAVIARLRRDARPTPRIINATGVVLHSGLGRAPLSPAAKAALDPGGDYCLLEVDRAQGTRRARDTACAQLLCDLTGAEAALVVNNNAAATVLILQALARGREVICSRGEMVEIGGSFRIPEVMEASGARLVAVGATNRTNISDYAAAIGPDTGALLVVHTSNYRIVGFTGRPDLEEISALGREHGIPVVHDLGSGSLLGPEALGVGDEPPVRASLVAGADVVCMSGDKLLGGPQAGIILGRADIVKKLRDHPLARAFRIDKLRVAALEATLELFLDPNSLTETHTVTRMLRASRAELLPRAHTLAAAIRTELTGEAALPCEVIVVDAVSEAGSGALPAIPLPSAAVALRPVTCGADALAGALRNGDPGVFAVIRENAVLLDVRTIDPAEIPLLAHTVGIALRSCAATKSAPPA